METIHEPENFNDIIRNIPDRYQPRVCNHAFICQQNAIYHWGYESLCYSCAVDKYDQHHFTCVACGQIFENKHAPWITNNPLCGFCKRKYRKELSRVNQQNSRTRKMCLVSDLTLSEWLGVLDEHSHKCKYCGDDYKGMDHVIAVSNGGGTTKGNVVPACTKCNSSKWAN